MQEHLYQVQWILNPDDPHRPGLFGTTSHAGATPAAAAIASAESIAHAVEPEWGRAQMMILRVSEKRSGENLLSGGDLQAALRRSPDRLPIEIVYRPLC